MSRKRILIVTAAVVATLGAAGGYALYLSNMREAVAKTKLDLEAFERGLAQYKFVKSRYPPAEEGLEASIKAWAVLQCAQTSAPQKCIDQPRRVPLDAWGNAFRYRTDSPTHAVVTSAGPDGKFETSDDLHLKSP